jgi:hypothetical protein
MDETGNQEARTEARHVDAKQISPRPIEPERRPLVRGVLPVVGLTGLLAVGLYLLLR